MSFFLTATPPSRGCLGRRAGSSTIRMHCPSIVAFSSLGMLPMTSPGIPGLHSISIVAPGNWSPWSEPGRIPPPTPGGPPWTVSRSEENDNNNCLVNCFLFLRRRFQNITVTVNRFISNYLNVRIAIFTFIYLNGAHVLIGFLSESSLNHNKVGV